MLFGTNKIANSSRAAQAAEKRAFQQAANGGDALHLLEAAAIDRLMTSIDGISDDCLARATPPTQ